MSIKESEKDLSCRIQELEKTLEVMCRRVCWLENNYQEQQLLIENLHRRIENDFPVARWEDD